MSFVIAKRLCMGLKSFAGGKRCFSLSTIQRSPAIDDLTLCSNKDGVRIVTLNNQSKRHALSLDMLKSLYKRLSDDNANLRVVILRSTGNVFSAGHDLRELKTQTGSEYHAKVFAECTRVMKLVQDLPVPVIAQVQGLATAAGCQLVASCDIAVAGQSSKFATPGVSVGLFCSTPGVAVARAVPRKVALKMLFTGMPITAQEALTHGLVSQVVPDDQVESEVMKIANKICETSKPVVALGKKFFYSQVSLDRDAAYKKAEATMLSNLKLKDCQEGIDAFASKRHPKWSHANDEVSA